MASKEYEYFKGSRQYKNGASTAQRFCKHCGERGECDRRWTLCVKCFNDPIIKPLYHRVRGRGIGKVTNNSEERTGYGVETDVGRPLAPYPTQFIPGTEGKVDVIEWRAKNGYHIWHPLDAIPTE